MKEVRTTESSNFQFVLQGGKSQKQQVVGESGSNFQIILYGDKSTSQDLTVNEPPAYRSTYVSGAQINDSGHLILSFSDGTTVDSGYVRGGTGAQGPQGASLVWRGEWVSTANYNNLDCVTYDGNVYIYISSIPSVGVPVTDTTKWELMLRRGEAGTNGITFTPSVSADGVLSWTNNGNLTNPASVNIKGQPGSGFKVLGYYSTVSALTSSVTSPSVGDAYGVGTSEPYDIYIFDGVTRKWVNNGQLQGAQGKPGENYVLTDADKHEIAGLVNAPVTSVNGEAGDVRTTFEIPLTSVDGTATGNDVGVTTTITRNDIYNALVSGATVIATLPEYILGHETPMMFTLQGYDGDLSTIDNAFTLYFASTDFSAGVRWPVYIELSVDTGGVTGTASVFKPLNEGSVFTDETAIVAEQTARVNIESHETIKVIFGKIQKWLSDLGSLAFKSKVAKADLDTDVPLLPSVTTSDNGKVATVVNGVWAKKVATSYNTFTGAAASTAGTAGLVPAPAAGQQASYLRGDGTWGDATTEPFYVGCGIHAKDTYDQSVTHTKTYDEIVAAYKAGKACYARVKLFGAYNTNLLLLPLAEVDEAMGYVNFASTKTTQGDTPEKLMIYYVHIDSDGSAEGYWGTRYTLSGSEKFLPSVTAADNGKFMCVANGAWSAVTVPDAEGGSY